MAVVVVGADLLTQVPYWIDRADEKEKEDAKGILMV